LRANWRERSADCFGPGASPRSPVPSRSVCTVRPSRNENSYRKSLRASVAWSIGFTEPGGGTDVLGAMKTQATRTDGGWVINGGKMWCTAARAADYILLLAPLGQERRGSVTKA